MTRPNLHCIHEPFGDAFYYGPERLSSRFANDERARSDSGFSNSTYQGTLNRFEHEAVKVWSFIPCVYLVSHTALCTAKT